MWKDEYVKLAFPIKASDLKIEEAQLYKYKNMPSSFFRYRAFNDNNIENLINEVEWQSYPSEFNDPYDARLTISIDTFKSEQFKRNFETYLTSFSKLSITFTQEEKMEILSNVNPSLKFFEIGLAHHPDIQNQPYTAKELASIIDKSIESEYERMIDKLRTSANTGNLIICFSEVNNNILLWSHYAENHTGFCIEYDFKLLGPKHVRCRMLEPVIYVDDLFDATIYYLETLADIKNHNNLFGIYPTISKSKQWQYEQEWRLIFPWGPGISLKDKERRSLSMPTPKKLYIGARASEENKEKIIQIAKQIHTPVYQKILDPSKFNLEEKVLYNPL
ncbi:DUF2971 domain-containing protein [Viridibacillus sp. FSL R5-0477]|uniref:DUF2971 domain-containing protein n=1 Tax=Viridibacillus arenosi FSL R5-213 TaxID=1227360 RepID=W4EUD3_9BACL|nr:DUF2971 domain-containing protein [Viridibacillus arenosi]ETT84150.1 hypothetical protein C176_12318 [Viridibacillus arenosi FSL R5-213]OMC90054.1 hypothetical protein BK137_15015 [Viridibacillus arenosi]